MMRDQLLIFGRAALIVTASCAAANLTVYFLFLYLDRWYLARWLSIPGLDEGNCHPATLYIANSVYSVYFPFAIVLFVAQICMSLALARIKLMLGAIVFSMMVLFSSPILAIALSKDVFLSNRMLRTACESPHSAIFIFLYALALPVLVYLSVGLISVFFKGWKKFGKSRLQSDQ